MNHFKEKEKKKKKKDIVISAFISSNTGELVNNIFQVFHKNYRRYFRDKKPQALGSVPAGTF